MKKRRKVIIIAVAVVAAHLAVLWIFADMHVLPKRTLIPGPNFSTAEGSVVDPKTGDKTTIHEYTVSTKLEKESRPDQ